MALEQSCEVALIAEPRRDRDVAQRGGRPNEFAPGELDAHVPDVARERRVVATAERPREMHRMDPDVSGDRGQWQRFGEMPLDERARPLEPLRQPALAGARHAPRRLGQDAERDALDGEARHFVAQPELAVQAVREMDDEPALE